MSWGPSDTAIDRVLHARSAAAALGDDDPVFLSLRDTAMVEADIGTAVERGLPLAGMTFAVKNNIDVAGLPTTAACPSYAVTPAVDAPAVARLRAAGAVCIGATNMDQFATGLVGTRSPHGTPINPVDPTLVPGGSSSGSAVAVAGRIVDVALGTDTAGSGRVPAAQTRIVGLKPTRGLIPTAGVVPAVASLDCVSVFGRDVEAASAALWAMAGPLESDAWSRTVAATAGPLRRIGVPSDPDLDGPVDEAAWQDTLDRAAELGVELITVDLDVLRRAGELLYGGPWVAERLAAVGDHVLGGHADVDPTVLAIVQAATALTARQAYEGTYALADLRIEAASLWTGLDALLVPTTPGAATLAQVAADPIGRNTRLGRWTNAVNLLDLCAVAVPGVDRADGVPTGVQLLAPAGGDAAAAGLGRRLHIATAAATVDVVVVGAHLRGMPLNHELTTLGATFVESTSTAPSYRLLAMPGTIPKPALVHDPDGGAILVEVWALPAAAVGTFLSGIPSPLGLGRVELADGRSVTGFIAEPRAADGAEDVTRFGGWRAFLAD